MRYTKETRGNDANTLKNFQTQVTHISHAHTERRSRSLYCGVSVPSSSRRHLSEITTRLTELRWDLNLRVTMSFNGKHWPSPGKNYKPATRARRNMESKRTRRKRHEQRGIMTTERQRSRWWWKLWIHRCSLTNNQRKTKSRYSVNHLFFVVLKPRMFSFLR